MTTPATRRKDEVSPQHALHFHAVLHFILFQVHHHTSSLFGYQSVRTEFGYLSPNQVHSILPTVCPYKESFKRSRNHCSRRWICLARPLLVDLLGDVLVERVRTEHHCPSDTHDHVLCPSSRTFLYRAWACFTWIRRVTVVRISMDSAV